jgi:hypothetical protein
VALLTVIESYAIVDKTPAAKQVLQKRAAPPQIKEIKKVAKKPIPVKSTSDKTNSKKRVGELT